MTPQRKIHLLRLVVLFILAVALIKYFRRPRPPQVIQAVKAHKSEEFFWGAAKASSENENRDLPPEPPKEEKVEVSVKTQQNGGQLPRKDFSNVQMKLVHLDLKGAAPKLSYFEQIFPLLSKLGANGLLIEYEDMFPFTGELEVLRSPHAYSESDIKNILHLAEINKLEVVPLVQTFGHMEFVLKHDKFRGLREMEQYPNSLNPHNADSLPLVKMILSQVLDQHPTSSWIHIGADEVYHLGEGQDSKAWLNSNKGDLGKMFLTYIQEVVAFLHSKYPDKQQLMWDDMLRKLSVASIQGSGISQHVSPVLWIYSPHLNIEQTETLISKYQESGFKSIWFASAFKGASTADQMWTPMSLHVKNHQQWKTVIDSMKSKFTRIRYAGIALTGWQRYDHYSVLCELLPVSIPSLAVCLEVLQHGDFNEKVRKETASLLGFKAIDIETNTCDGNGAFPGAEIYSLVQKIHKDLKQKVQELLEGDEEIRGWFSRYHRKHRFGNPHKMEKFSSKLLKAHEEWESLTQSLRTQLESIYFPDTVEEWMEENVNPHLDLLREVVRDFQEILKLNAQPKAQSKK
ncbi:hexosaminidase D-like [Spea bombifrons]|uniref:hexosaminidase D-like n=1 Tax=Spea bombifrons TaxID=233779 RepID=UPI00234BE335|nr:hexosaminidase D-like [Spea bombifrons]